MDRNIKKVISRYSNFIPADLREEFIEDCYTAVDKKQDWYELKAMTRFEKYQISKRIEDEYLDTIKKLNLENIRLRTNILNLKGK